MEFGDKNQSHRYKLESVLGTAMKTAGRAMVWFSGPYILCQMCLTEEGWCK